MIIARWAVAIAMALSTYGCAGRTPEVTGTVAFDAPEGLPVTAVLEVTLQDVSRAGAPSETIGLTRVTAPKASPVPFAIEYDPAIIADTHEYAVRARILDGDRLLFTSDTRHAVITRGSGTTATLSLEKVPQAAALPPPLVKGLFVIAADGRWFTRCGEPGRVQVSAGGDYTALEASYLAARRTPGEPLLARVEGAVEGGEFVVRKFVSVAVAQDCASE